MKVDYYLYSNCGERSVNQDAVGVCEQNEYILFALCDGLGGHGGGEIASQTAVDAIIAAARTDDENLIDRCMNSADESVLKKTQGDNDLKNMKTTAVLLFVRGSIAQWAHMGDSRLYYFRKHKYVKRTLDHSIPQTLVAIGEIKESEIRHHADRNKLLKCFPSEGKSFEKSEAVNVSKGDSFVLMSDGFWDWIDSKDISKALKKNKTAKLAAQQLVDLAFKRGKDKNMDNLSIIIARLN